MKNSFLSFKKGRFNLQIKLPLAIITLLVLSFISVTILSVLASRSALTNALKNSLETETLLQTNGIRSYLTWTRSMAVDLGASVQAIDLTEETSLTIIEQMLSRNDQIFGSTIAYEPYTFQPSLKYWAPYYSRAENGILRFSQLGTPEYNYFQQDWYKLAKDSKSIILSPPYFDAGGGEIWMVTWSAPFYDQDGKLKGITTADIAFSQTQEIVRQVSVGKQGYAFLVDPNGVILGIGDHGGQYKPMEDSILISDSLTQADAWNKMVNEMTQGNSGFADLIDPQGEAMFVAYEPIGMSTGWSLGLAFPQTELFQPAVQLQNSLIFFSILILIVASAILLILSRTITRPLQEITSWAKLFSQGQMNFDMDQPASSLHINTNDEMEDLANAFNQMSSELSATMITLEQRVADRTKALAIVSEVSTATSTILEVDKLLQEVVNLSKERFNLYHAHIYLLDEAGENLMLASGAGEPGRQMVAKGFSIPLNREQSLVARAARERKGVTVNDVTQAPDFLPNPLLPDTRSELAVPLIVGDKVLGVFDVQSNQVGRFTESDINIQNTLASQVAVSIQNARTFAQAEQQKRQNELILGSAGEGIFGLDKQGNHTFVNPAGAEMLGYSIEELIGKHSHTMWHHTHADGTPFPGETCPIYATLNEGVIHQGEEYFIRKDGMGFHVSFSSVPIKEEGRTVGAVVTFADITQQKSDREFTEQRAKQQESLNRITQRIQSSTSVEDALQIAARELGHALGMKSTLVTLDPETMVDEQQGNNGSGA